MTEPTAPASAPAQDDITTLRAHLFETLRAVRAGSVELDKARAINEISKTIIETGKLEVDHIRATDGDAKSSFIARPDDSAALPNGITGIVRHRLEG